MRLHEETGESGANNDEDDDGKDDVHDLLEASERCHLVHASAIVCRDGFRNSIAPFQFTAESHSVVCDAVGVPTDTGVVFACHIVVPCVRQRTSRAVFSDRQIIFSATLDSGELPVCCRLLSEFETSFAQRCQPQLPQPGTAV